MTNKRICSTLLILITVVGCELKDNSQALKIQLHDEQQKADSIEIITYDVLNYSENVVLSESIRNLGDKSVDITIKSPVFANLKIDETFHQIYLESVFDLHIHLDNQDGSTYLKYSGDGSVVNNYLEQSSQVMNKFYRDNPSWFRMNRNTFSNALDSLEIAFNIRLEKFDFDQKILEVLKTKNKITLINLRQQHRLVNADSYASEKATNSSFSLSKDIPFDSYFLELSLLDYAQVLDLFLRSEIQEPMFSGKNVDELDSIKDFFPIATSQIIIEKNFPKGISEFLRAKDISYWLASEGISEGLETVYVDFRNDFEDSNYNEQLEEKYNEWLRIGKGQPAPEITGLTLDNDTISLSDLKGKVVYVDVWATWCAPCVKEFPYYKELQERVGERDDIEFLFVSVDQQAEKWVSFLSEREIPKGIHIREGVGFGHPSVQESYNMWGVPRYILIDRNGKIVNSNAPRPSLGRVYELINSL